LDYKKMSNGGSLDSMDKSQLNSSLEDNHCYDVYEAHNPRYSPGTSAGGPGQKYVGDNPAYDLTYRNEGFRNHSTFTSRNNSAWQSEANSVASPEVIYSISIDLDARAALVPQVSSPRIRDQRMD
jgi:hypothetical protein